MKIRFKTISQLSGEEFRRLTEVKRESYNKMVEILTEARKAKKALGGRPNKLRGEDTLLMTLKPSP